MKSKQKLKAIYQKRAHSDKSAHWYVVRLYHRNIDGFMTHFSESWTLATQWGKTPEEAHALLRELMSDMNITKYKEVKNK